MPYKFIGRTTDFKGKTLWEILGNLKNFGVGRIVARNMFERYPEASFIKIIKVEALPNPKNPSLDDCRKVIVTVEKTFRGKKFPNLIKMESVTYKADYKLIPKDEEASYCKLPKVEDSYKILPKYTVFPPLMRELLMKEMIAAGNKPTEPQLEIVYTTTNPNKYKIAEDGDKPTVVINPPLGPKISSLYNNIKM